MKHWFSLNLGDPILDNPLQEQLKKLLNDKNPAFYRHESEGRLHCEMIVYLPPSAKEVAEKLHALPCAKPARKGLGVLYGAADSLTYFFPE